MQTNQKKESNIFSTIVEDFRNGGLRADFTTDWDELKTTLLDRRKLQRLESMSRFKRSIHSFWWLLERMILMLRPARRLLLIVSIITLIFSIPNAYGSGTPNVTILAGIVLLLLLMMELKDKVMAHNELDAGRVVQTAMLPEEIPEFGGYRIWLYSKPAREVGGDLIDYIRLDDDECGIACGDVAGKGLEAALFMVKLQSTLRSLASIINDLEELASKINEIFYYGRMKSKFSSLLYLILNKNNGKIRLFNAGHMQPIIIRDSQTEELPKVSPAIGIMKKAPFRQQTAELNQNDFFVVYSDGLTEARNDFGDFFGQKRLLRLLRENSHMPPDRLGHEIISRVEKFCGFQRIGDDLSLVIIQKTDDTNNDESSKDNDESSKEATKNPPIS